MMAHRRRSPGPLVSTTYCEIARVAANPQKAAAAVYVLLPCGARNAPKNGTKLSPAIALSNLGAPVNDWGAAPSDDIIIPTLTTTGWGQATSAVT